MNADLVDFYRERIEDFAQMLSEAETTDERLAISECIVTCELRLAGVP